MPVMFGPPSGNASPELGPAEFAAALASGVANDPVNASVAAQMISFLRMRTLRQRAPPRSGHATLRHTCERRHNPGREKLP
jgi:hypothetical protein